MTPCFLEASAYAENNQNVFLYSFDHMPKNPIFDEEYMIVDIFGAKKRVLKRELQDISSNLWMVCRKIIFDNFFAKF